MLSRFSLARLLRVVGGERLVHGFDESRRQVGTRSLRFERRDGGPHRLYTSAIASHRHRPPGVPTDPHSSGSGAYGGVAKRIRPGMVGKVSHVVTGCRRRESSARDHPDARLYSEFLASINFC